MGDIPEELICLNWNYSHNADEDQVKKIYETGREQFVCPGVAGWSQLMNFIDNGFENIRKMVSYGVKYGATGVLNTDWGDYGHINLLANSIPGMAFGAAMSWNPDGFNNLEDSYKAISLIEYGDDSLEVVSLLNKLSKNQVIGWSELVLWKERYNKDIAIRELIKNIDYQKLESGYNTADNIQLELTKILPKVKNKEDMQEFIVSAQGIKLINIFFLILLRESFDNKNVNTMYEAEELAENLELWFYDYSKIWRRRNKESELYRIREVIQYTCKYLRSI